MIPSRSVSPSSPPLGSLRSSADFSRALQSSGGSSSERLQRAVDLVVELVDGCDHAGVTVIRSGVLSSPAVSDDVARRGDAWQYELGEGPCVDTVQHQQTVIAHDLSADRRWLRWSPRVIEELGINAMMSMLLYTDTDHYGALNFYADTGHAWDHHQIAVAHSLAGHLAVAVADATVIDNRGRAMVSRTVIGQAEGILMERFGLDAEAAFAYLRRVSQASNHKLIRVAEELVATRRLPDAGATGATGGD